MSLMLPDVWISFGGIPNSRNVLFLQIFLKRAAKLSAGKPQLGFRELNGRKSCWTWPGSAPSPEPSPEPCWTWPGSAPKPPCPEPCWTWLGSAPKPPRPSPEPSPEPFWSWPGSASKPPATFSGTSLNLTRRLHQCTPELFWAEDPISLRWWGKKSFCFLVTRRHARSYLLWGSGYGVKFGRLREPWFIKHRVSNKYTTLAVHVLFISWFVWGVRQW